jgi:hypothetical protein
MAGLIRPSGDGYLVGTFTAAEAIARGQFVYLADDGLVAVATDKRNPVIGVALEAADSGAPCTVVRGYCLALAGEAIAIGNLASELIVGTDGRAELADANFSATYGWGSLPDLLLPRPL